MPQKIWRRVALIRGAELFKEKLLPGGEKRKITAAKLFSPCLHVDFSFSFPTMTYARGGRFVLYLKYSTMENCFTTKNVYDVLVH